jgi:uncharacterized protein (TIGR02466 family)
MVSKTISGGSIPSTGANERLKMNVNLLFPILVTDDYYYDHLKFKKIFLENAFKHMSEDGYSSESTGNVDIHLDPAFEKFFKFVAGNIKQYINTMNVDPEIFDYSLVKSWLNITKESDNPIHNHADAHISFSYYVNIPKNIQKNFVMYRPDDTADLYKGFLNFNIKEHNVVNSSTWRIPPVEGQIIVFPSKLEHSVMSNDQKDPIVAKDEGSKTVDDLLERRICIAGDFILTHKNKTTQYLGLQPIKNWRIFN